MIRLVIAMSLLATALAVGCSDAPPPPADERERFESKQDELSLVVPSGWAVTHDRGALILASSEHPRRTIAIRSLPLSGGGAAAKVTSATETVLRNLPGVDDLARRPFSGPISGIEYQLTFEPDHRGRYARRHLLLTGERRGFHVIETAPDRVGDDAIFGDLVASLREES